MSKEMKFQTLHCVCGDWLKMEYKSLNETIDEVQIIMDEAPSLICPSCDKQFTPDLMKIILKQIVDEAKKRGTPLVRSSRKKQLGNKRFDLCKNIQLKYDANDYRYIPGLVGFAKEGFFTPVFFEKRVLHKYMEFDEYRLDIASNTYGTIFHDHWQLSFGINRSGKVFVWLGDLDEIPLKEQQYFLSENIDSDHDVGSEFYAAQREAEFTELSDENKLLTERSHFDSICNGIGVKIFRYKKDAYEILGDLIRPVNWNEKGVIHVVNTLNKLCVESINSDSLKKEIKKLERDFDTKSLGSLKLMQKWTELRCSDIDTKNVMKPFFVLYDFRIIFDHEMEKSDERQALDFCYERLGIMENRNYESLYDEIVGQITDSYNKIATSLAK